MAARVGHTRDDVVAAAIALLDESQSLESVSLGAVARQLGIKPQSLYAHVDGLDGLRRAIAAAGLGPLSDAVTLACIGVTGEDAVRAIIRVHLDFARRHPALYEAVIEPPRGDTDLELAITTAGAPLEIVLETLGLDLDERVHWTRLFLAAVYGYATLNQAGRFALPTPTAETEDHLVTMLVAQLRAVSRSR